MNIYPRLRGVCIYINAVKSWLCNCVKSPENNQIWQNSVVLYWGKFQLPESSERPLSRPKIWTYSQITSFTSYWFPLLHTAWHCPLLLSNSSITYTHAHQCQIHFTVRPQPPLCVAGRAAITHGCVNTGTQAHTLHLINVLRSLDMTAQPRAGKIQHHTVQNTAALSFSPTFSLLLIVLNKLFFFRVLKCFYPSYERWAVLNMRTHIKSPRFQRCIIFIFII